MNKNRLAICRGLSFTFMNILPCLEPPVLEAEILYHIIAQWI